MLELAVPFFPSSLILVPMLVILSVTPFYVTTVVPVFSTHILGTDSEFECEKNLIGYESHTAIYIHG